MKKLKAKSILLGLFAVVALSTILTSCEQNTLEDLHPLAEEQLTLIEDRIPLVIGTWWNSYEEETNPIEEKVYRRDDYNFPASRLRTGFTFDADGDFVYYHTDAAGRPVENHGTWRFFNNQTILIRFDLSIAPPISARFPRINVISIVNNTLVIEPLDW